MSKNIKLNNGIEIPKLGFGTIGQDGEQIIDNVAFALQNGYKLIDTANRYDNEVAVGKGLKKSSLRRDSYFLETKLGPTLYETESAIDDTLKRLDVDYIDVMLLHHPVNNYINAYKMLEQAYNQGKLRAIGISNFPVEKIQEILDMGGIPPAIMQVECHPYYPAEMVKAYCEEHKIALQSWFPLGHGNNDLLNDQVLTELANKHKKSVVQIILRWHTQMGFGLVPGSKSFEHIKDNSNIFDIELSAQEMELIAGINKHTPFYHVTAESLQRMATTKCSFEK